ncbi:MAG: hypothetical protein R3Y24_17715 [Eubacteriales bacterium]
MKKNRIMGLVLTVCCLFAMGGGTVFAEENIQNVDDTYYAEMEQQIILDEFGNKVVLEEDAITKSSCTHIPCNQVTVTVYKHDTNGFICRVYKGTALQCKCCNQIIKLHNNWQYIETIVACPDH